MRLWLIPMVYALGSILAALALPRLEAAFLPAVHAEVSAASAQAFLSAISSGMMALTGIVYSIAFVMVQFSAVAFSPRLVMWFGRDPMLFHAMGMFFATFCYSLAALLWIDRGGVAGVPLASLWLVGVLLIASILLFARLVQRLSMLQITEVLRYIGDRGRRVIRDTFERDNGLAGAPAPDLGGLAPVILTLHHTGAPHSVLSLDVAGLVREAAAADAIIVLDCAVGDTLVEDSVILRVHGPRAPAAAALRRAVRLGRDRTFEQDPKLALRLLVDIAIKALSPAINDPTTAVQALDQIEDLLRRLSKCQLGSGTTEDAQGRLRLVYPMPTWQDYLSLAFDEIRQFGADSVQVSRRLRSALAGLAESAARPARAEAVRAYVRHLDLGLETSRLDQLDRAIARHQDRQGLGLTRGSVT